MHRLALANSVHWCSHFSRSGDGHILKRALEFDVIGQWKKGRTIRKLEQVAKENMKVGESR